MKVEEEFVLSSLVSRLSIISYGAWALIL